MTEPPKKENAKFVPTSIPEPIMAGVHSRNHPQLSADMAKGVRKSTAWNHVKICQSFAGPLADIPES